MILPNKLFSYNQSTISKLPILLNQLEVPQSPNRLYKNLRYVLTSPIELMDALDCLYALGVVDIDCEGRVYKC